MGGIVEARSIGIVGTGSYTVTRISEQIPGLCGKLSGQLIHARHKSLHLSGESPFIPQRLNKFVIHKKNRGN